jgi:hypothetical protein
MILYEERTGSSKTLFEQFKLAYGDGTVEGSLDKKFNLNLIIMDFNSGLTLQEVFDCLEFTTLFRDRTSLIITKMYDFVEFVNNEDINITTVITDRKIQFYNRKFKAYSKLENFEEFIKLVQTQYLMCLKSIYEWEDLAGVITEGMAVPFLKAKLEANPSKSEELL